MAKKKQPPAATSATSASSSDRYYVTVNTFNPVAPKSEFRYCVIDQITGGGKDSTTDGTKIVVSKRCTLELFVLSTTGTNYTLIGAFLLEKRRQNNRPDPQGKVNFKIDDWDSRLVLSAKKVTPGTWKLGIVIADTTVNPPAIGLIDPDIENDAQVLTPMPPP